MSRIDAIRDGDRDAYRELLSEHGASLAQLLASWGQDVDPAKALVTLWKETVFAEDGLDERKFLAATLVGQFAFVAERSQSELPYLQADVSSLARAAARKAAGLAEQEDVEMLEDRAEEPGVKERVAQIETWVAQVLKAEAGAWPYVDDNWAELRPQLT